MLLPPCLVVKMMNLCFDKYYFIYFDEIFVFGSVILIHRILASKLYVSSSLVISYTAP